MSKKNFHTIQSMTSNFNRNSITNLNEHTILCHCCFCSFCCNCGFNFETAIKANAAIKKTTRYFNKQLRLRDWRTFSLRVLVNVHVTLTISYIGTAFRTGSFLHPLALIQSFGRPTALEAEQHQLAGISPEC